MNDEYITIGMLQDTVTSTVWVGTDKATQTECTISVRGMKGKYGWENYHWKVSKEDLKSFIAREISLLELARRREPGSLIFQNVNAMFGYMDEKRNVEQLTAVMEARLDWKYQRLRCLDYEDIGEFLGMEM